MRGVFFSLFVFLIHLKLKGFICEFSVENDSKVVV